MSDHIRELLELDKDTLFQKIEYCQTMIDFLLQKQSIDGIDFLCELNDELEELKKIRNLRE